MTKYPFEAANVKATGKAFPDLIESDPNIVFHGTSCAYASRIESKGFEYGYRPWTAADLRHIAESIRETHPVQSSDFSRWAETQVRLSFARKSHRACTYAIGAVGGQTLRFVRPFRGPYGIVPDGLEKVLSDVDASDVCVYAVSLQDIPASQKRLEAGVWYVTTLVPPSALLGKTIIPRGTPQEAIEQPGISDLLPGRPDVPL